VLILDVLAIHLLLRQMLHQPQVLDIVRFRFALDTVSRVIPLVSYSTGSQRIRNKISALCIQLT
jgi:hypothetical protein